MSDQNLRSWLEDDTPTGPRQATTLDQMFNDGSPTDATEHYAHQVAREDLDLAGYVAHTKSLLSGDPEATEFLRSLTLTRNHQIDRAQYEQLQEKLRELHIQYDVKVNEAEFQLISRIVYDDILGLGPMGDLWRDDTITEIMMTAHDTIFVERKGKVATTNVTFKNLKDAQEVMRSLARQANRELSLANPVVDAQLADGGARLLLMIDPIPTSGIDMTLRKRGEMMGIDQLLEFGSLTEEMRDFLADAVRAKTAILISGGTGSGKTTVINALSEYIDPTERVWTIEDTLELQLHHPHVVRVQEKKPASQDDTVTVTQGDLIKASMRGRPDRILVGEMRDSEAANVMIQAAESGHDGTMTTIHSNTPHDALNQRLYGFLAEARPTAPDHVIRQMILNAFQIVVQVTRQRGKRFTREIALVGDQLEDGSVPTIPLWTGELSKDSTTVNHTRTNPIPQTSRLHERFLDEGLDPSRWTTTP